MSKMKMNRLGVERESRLREADRNILLNRWKIKIFGELLNEINEKFGQWSLDEQLDVLGWILHEYSFIKLVDSKRAKDGRFIEITLAMVFKSQKMQN